MKTIIFFILAHALMFSSAGTALAAPVLEIRANGVSGPVNITTAEELSITVAVAENDWFDVDADWWCAVQTSHPAPFDWFYFDANEGGWVEGFEVSYQGKLPDLTAPFEVLRESGIPAGDYTFYFGADDNMNGWWDGNNVYASVTVHVTEWPFPTSLFNIGDSIGEAEAAYADIGSANHDTVWSSGYDRGDVVYSLNERLEDLYPEDFYENNAARDHIFNHAVSGSTMADFEDQAVGVAAGAAFTPLGKAGVITAMLGSNDVCASSLNGMTDPAVFENQYRAGLDVLVASDATRNSHIRVSSIPAIYWLWESKRSDFWCRLIVWPLVPCQNLLDNPSNDCGSGGSHLLPDTIFADDGANCVRRKQFHANIRDIYNPILQEVLDEYQSSGLLPHAQYVDIFDTRFDENDINDGDCFHPSARGHQKLADENWCKSPWGSNDPACDP